jgi:hypothetical protein
MDAKILCIDFGRGIRSISEEQTKKLLKLYMNIYIGGF